MNLSAVLLLVAFRHKIEEPDLDNGLLRVATIAGRDVNPSTFHAVLADALADGYIYDPALQCHWRLELTPHGVDQVMDLLREHGKTADELLLGAGIPDPLTRRCSAA
jgi:hypothetical protein